MTDDERIRQVEIDWVEIPEGEFLTGISERQRAMLRERLWAELGLEEMELPRRQVVERLARKLQRAARDRGYDLKKNLTKEERKVKRESNNSPLENVLWAMRELEKLPEQRTDLTKCFYIARFPITKRQAGIFYDSDFARRFRLDELRLTRSDHLADMPEDVFWMVADAFAHWLGGRLPTAHEWEKAARGTDGRLYPWGDEWDPGKGSFGLQPPPERPNGLRTPRRVVSAYPKGQSPLGVWDMVGNGQEWTTLDKCGPNLKGFAYNGPRPPVWYWCLPARTDSGWVELDVLGSYRKNIGFRPVIDRWVHKVWVGFRSEDVPKRNE